MGEILKDKYNKEFLQNFSNVVRASYETFDKECFVATVLSEPWDNLELRGRMKKISQVLGGYLPEDYEEALNILFAIDENCDDFLHLFFPDFIEIYGQGEEHWDLSMRALERFTKRTSSEFAIRPFLIKDPKRGMEQMLKWAKHPNEHVRRLASEGCRPRLPWGISLPMFKKDPQPVLEILELLKEDTSLYVRKSVANNLNDIAKDNPEVVIEITKKWIGKNPLTDWILRHGNRNLIRNGNPDALKLFGYADTSNINHLIKNATIKVDPSFIKIGDHCNLQYEFDVIAKDSIHIRVEYAIDFVKASGKTSRKLFLLRDKHFSCSNHVIGEKAHSFENLTIRKHYPGEHKITLMMNGQEMICTSINLSL